MKMANWFSFTKGWCHYTVHSPPEESSQNHQHHMNMVFANHSEEDVMYPLTVKEIAQAQEKDLILKKLSITYSIPLKLLRIQESYVKMAALSSPKFFS